MTRSDQLFDVFSESEYLRKYPDVRNAIDFHGLQSGYQHYLDWGKGEARDFPTEQRTLSEAYEILRRIESTLTERKLCANLSHFVKKMPKKAIIVLYTPRAFEGNLKYTFLELIRSIRNQEIEAECYFLTLSSQTHSMLLAQGYPSLLWQDETKEIVRTLSQTAVLVHDAFFVDSPSTTPPLLYACLSSACRINLWHGTPLRKVLLQELDGPGKIDLHYSALLRAAVDNDVFCGTSAGDRKLFEDAMLIDDYSVTGYARNDVFYRDLSPEDMMNVDADAHANLTSPSRNYKTALYAPTWREGRADWITSIDLASLAAWLWDRGIKLLVNLHPFEMDRKIDYLQSIPGIELLKTKMDIYPLLKHIDLLITDYSSLAFDYLHVQRPILFFRPDHEVYLENNRSLIPERMQTFDVPLVTGVDECARNVITMLEDPQGYVAKLMPALRQAHDYHDPSSASRCARLIIKKMQAHLCAQRRGDMLHAATPI